MDRVDEAMIEQGTDKPKAAGTATPCVGTILADWLKSHGYDGLYQAGVFGCCCELSDLAPCDNPDPINCHAGYKSPCLDPKECECGGVACLHIARERQG